MKKLVLLFLFVFFIISVSAAPFVDIVSNQYSLSDEMTIIISGSDFGTKDEPLLWDEITNIGAYNSYSTADGEIVPTNGVTGGGSSVNPLQDCANCPWSSHVYGRVPRFYDSLNRRYAGHISYESKNLANTDGRKGYFARDFDLPGTSGTTYLDWWVRSSHDLGVGQYGGVSGKFLRLWPGLSVLNQLIYAKVYSGGTEFFLSGNDCHDEATSTVTYFSMPIAEWTHVAVVTEVESNSGTSYAIINGQYSGELDHLCFGDGPYDYIRMMGYDPSISSNQYDDFEFLWGDVYFDKGMSRIIISESSEYNPYGNTNTNHYEMQIPDSWLNDEISLTVNKGGFSNGQTYYLFVVNENGEVSNAKPVSFSPGAIPDCSLTSASWSTTTADEGAQVTLTVNGNNCDGKQLDFELFDTDDFLLFVDLDPVAVTNPSSTTFNSGVATQTWITEWVDDTDGGDSDPEYVFVASLNEDSSVNIESSNILKVSQVIPGVPHVSDVSNLGVLNHGDSFSISGSEFGVKSPVAPYVWDDFESGAEGNVLGSTTNGISYSLQSSNSNDPTYTGTYVYSGLVSGHADSEIGKTSNAHFILPNNQFYTVYANYKMRWRNADTTSDPFLNARVGKLGRFAGAPGDQVHNRPIISVNTQVNYDQTLVWISPDRTQGIDVTDYITNIIENNWHALEIEGKRSSVAGSADGWHNVRLDGKLESEAYDYVNYNSLSEWDNGYYAFNLPYYMDACGNEGCTAGLTGMFHYYYDDVYLDNTISRIEICDVSTWAEKELSGSHCEIQIPHTTWDGTTIQFTANQGALNPDQTYYLFVIDSDGTVSNGKAISFTAAVGCTDGETRTCGSNVGECSAGTETCSGGTWGSCVGEIIPTEEICGNGLDDDCDTLIDEDCPTGCIIDEECNYLDNLPCTEGVCNAGACEVSYTTNSCDDGITCTENDICSAGTCGAGTLNDLLCPVNENCLTKTCTATGCSYSDCTVSGTLITHLTLDSDYSDVTGSYNGICTSCPTQITGQLSGAYDFDGISNSLNIGDVLVNDQITITAWVNLDAVNSCGPRIISKASGTQTADHYWMMGVCDGEVRTRIKAGGTTDTLVGGSISEVEGFVHLAVSYDGTTIKIYKNGIEVASQLHSVGGNLDLGTGVDTLIGFNTGGSADSYFDGIIDDVRVYESALSLTDIQAVMIDGDISSPTCTDSDGDTYSVEGGVCGEVDCNDDNAGINPGEIDSSCNGIDEDCSGVADQSYVSISTSCGVGECSSLGSTSCSAGSIGDSCTAGSPTIEICDGLDNNCEGNIDEGLDCGSSGISQTINLDSGWNVVSLGLVNLSLTSEDLESTYVMRYNNGWESDWNGVSGDEFSLEALRGYYVYSSSAKSLTFSGSLVSSEYSLIDNTWNLVSFNSTVAGSGFAVSVNGGVFDYVPVAIFVPGAEYWVAVGDVLFGPPFSSSDYTGVVDWTRWLFSC